VGVLSWQAKLEEAMGLVRELIAELRELRRELAARKAAS
jgi:hypothetical protein